MEDALDVAPVAHVALGGLAEGGFDEVLRKLLRGEEEPFGDERRDRPDMLLVQVEDVGSASGLRFVGDGSGAEFEVAAPGAGHGAAGGGVVHEVDGLLAASACEVEGEQGAELDAGGQPAVERLAAAGEGRERGCSVREGPDLVGGDETGLVLLLLNEARDPEESEQVARFAHGGQHGGVEGVGDGGGLADAGEALEGGVAHRSNSSGGRSSSSAWSIQSLNWARRCSNRSSTVPTGPLRCFATMTWATPCG